MSWLAEDLVPLALCWRIERCDGVTIGLTGHDRDLEIDGLLYRAAPGMVPSAIVRAEGLEGDTMDVAGALTHAAFREADLLTGRWDGARVVLFAADWTGVGASVPLSEGRIGAVELSDEGFTAELAGVAAALERRVAEATSPDCRAELGDRRCRVPMAGRRRMARVVASAGAVLTMDRAEPEENGYGEGRLRWFDGEGAGMEAAIAASAGFTVTLRRAPAFDPAGAAVLLIEGCDKRMESCAARFGNAANFRGEPYLPGIDLLTRYPGA